MYLLLSTIVLLTLTLAQDIPPAPKLLDFIYTGTGCLNNSLSHSISPPLTSTANSSIRNLNIGLDDFRPLYSRYTRDNTKRCDIKFDVGVDDGWKVIVNGGNGTVMHGYIGRPWLGEKQRLNVTAAYAFPGVSGAQSVGSLEWRGPKNGVFTEYVGGGEGVVSACSGYNGGGTLRIAYIARIASTDGIPDQEDEGEGKVAWTFGTRLEVVRC